MQRTLVNRPHVRDQIIELGLYKGNGQCQQRMRLVEVFVNERWQRYLTTPAALERETGCQFFANLSPDVRAALRTKRDRGRAR